jgi:hypothetical protein
MYEYKLTAVPTRGRPQKGRRGLHEAFGVAIEEKMNKMIMTDGTSSNFATCPSLSAAFCGPM